MYIELEKMESEQPLMLSKQTLPKLHFCCPLNILYRQCGHFFFDLYIYEYGNKILCIHCTHICVLLVQSSKKNEAQT